MAKDKGKPPPKRGGKLAEPDHPTDNQYLLLSFRHVQKGFSVDALDQRQRADFLTKWVNRCEFKWSELGTQPRHGLGFEMLPARVLRATAPQHLAKEKYLVFRYSGKLPLVGFRAGDVFYVLWIERQFGDLYNHG